MYTAVIFTADCETWGLRKATDKQSLSTGVKTHEYTECTTGGMVNAQIRKYDDEIISKLGLPKHLFGEILQSWAMVGNLKYDVAKYVGGQTKVVLCASHDTGSAVEGIPMEKD